MNVALTGTPGTGKSTVSKHLREQGYQVLDLNHIALTEKLVISYDKVRETSEVNLDKLNEYLIKYLKTITDNLKDNVVFLEGHLSHLVEVVELIIVLRCHPSELRNRLNTKDWSDDKIRENLEAEALDAITIECVNEYGQDKIFEIDTTTKNTKTVLEDILKIIKGDVEGYTPGKIDWSEEILKWY